MALRNLVYRDQLFPRPAYARAFEALLVSGAKVLVTRYFLLAPTRSRGLFESYATARHPFHPFRAEASSA
jgi:hypothetical protein